MKNEDNDNIEMNYRIIFSLLWEKNLYFNQMKIKPSKNINANLFRFNVEPENSINILLTGFARCGKSTIINLFFDKLISRESLSPLPVTKNSIEYSYKQQNDENDCGIKIIDTPGIMEGIEDNQNLIKTLVNDSIKETENNNDNIHYILFISDTRLNLIGNENFFSFLNEIKIPVIFIINKVNFDNISKKVLKDYLMNKNYNKLIVGNDGDNIIEVNLDEGVNGKVNDIFKYIYNDLIHKNDFLINNHEINKDNINQYFENSNHNNNDLLKNIKGIDDIILRGEKYSNRVIVSFISAITGSGFCPIPGVDIPLFFILIATMLISILASYKIKLNDNFPYKRFFSFIFENEKAGKILEESFDDLQNNLNNEQIGRFSKIKKKILLAGKGTALIAISILKIVTFRTFLLGISEFLDFIPIIGWIAGGVVSAIINVPLAKKLGKNSKKFCKTFVRERRFNILNNIIEGYKKSVNIIKKFNDRINWERKIQIQEKLN